MVALAKAFKIGVTGALILRLAFVLCQVVRLSLAHSGAQMFFVSGKEHFANP
jgi:predicted tellurium resistance membrane protein TerC